MRQGERHDSSRGRRPHPPFHPRTRWNPERTLRRAPRRHGTPRDGEFPTGAGTAVAAGFRNHRQHAGANGNRGHLAKRRRRLCPHRGTDVVDRLGTRTGGPRCAGDANRGDCPADARHCRRSSDQRHAGACRRRRFQRIADRIRGNQHRRRVVRIVVDKVANDLQRALVRPLTGTVHTGPIHTGPIRTASIRTCSIRTASIHTGTIRTGTIRTGTIRTADINHTAA